MTSAFNSLAVFVLCTLSGSFLTEVSRQDDKEKIVEACESKWEANKSDCSAFVRAVTGSLGFEIEGNANTIIGGLGAQNSGWTKLEDGREAKQKADEGYLVIGGLKGNELDTPGDHGHVVIVVTGPLAHAKYPTAYWGRLGSEGKKNTTINYSWQTVDRDKVHYFARRLN